MKKSRPRTKKEFKDYNEYRDRPFGLKWGTAFALDELVKGINQNRDNALKVNEEYPQMSREEMDHVLQEAFIKSHRIVIQLNLRDYLGNLVDSLEGSFTGGADETYVYLDDIGVEWDTIRHIMLADSK